MGVITFLSTLLFLHHLADGRPGDKGYVLPFHAPLAGVGEGAVGGFGLRVTHPGFESFGEFRREGFARLDFDRLHLRSAFIHDIDLRAGAVAPEVDVRVAAPVAARLEKLQHDERLEKIVANRSRRTCQVVNRHPRRS